MRSPPNASAGSKPGPRSCCASTVRRPCRLLPVPFVAALTAFWRWPRPTATSGDLACTKYGAAAAAAWARPSRPCRPPSLAAAYPEQVPPLPRRPPGRAGLAHAWRQMVLAAGSAIASPGTPRLCLWPTCCQTCGMASRRPLRPDGCWMLAAAAAPTAPACCAGLAGGWHRARRRRRANAPRRRVAGAQTCDETPICHRRRMMWSTLWHVARTSR